VTSPDQPPTVLKLADTLVVSAGSHEVSLGPVCVRAGEWLLLRPVDEVLGPDPAVAIASVLAALESPLAGTVELFGSAVERLRYDGFARLRKQMALVPSSGGLLSNHTLRENVALPVSVHKALSHALETAEVTAILERFELLGSADFYPHEVSGGTRLRTCFARATALSPALYIVEGTGEFVNASQVGLSWTRLVEAQRQQGVSVVACVSRIDEEFDHWFGSVGGSVRSYQLSDDSAPEKGRLAK
jgi:predicted ABC-type transport system involved in lysophospholipase L1 biosynthesis ATPase subunit